MDTILLMNPIEVITEFTSVERQSGATMEGALVLSDVPEGADLVYLG